VETESAKPAAGKTEYKGGAKGQREGPGQQRPANMPDYKPPEYVEINKKFSDPKTSPLKTTLSRGEQKFNIEVD